MDYGESNKSVDINHPTLNLPPSREGDFFRFPLALREVRVRVCRLVL
jgi:hypothetical protein